MDLDFIRRLVKPAETRIVLLVMDGVGGLPEDSGGPTELEAAATPVLDGLAREAICGLHQPVGPGITPGSGPAHLALFGYDPVKYQVGRGVLAALGINFELTAADVAARGNFCTLDQRGRVTDRRAGRIDTERNAQLLDLLGEIKLPGAKVFLRPVRDYRLLLVLRGEGLSEHLTDTDPQTVDREPLEPRALSPEAEKTAELVREFARQARRLLAAQHPANMVLLRGFSRLPHWPQIEETFGLKAAAIAGYPMYRGLARLVGMEVLEAGERLRQGLDVLESNWNRYDFFYVHAKQIDSAGEDGDFHRKASLIEEVDAQIPRILDLRPDVFVITGDHSTPARLRSHSWHPVPVLLWSRYCRPDSVDRFSERACMAGGLGPRLQAVDLMPLVLANALRLQKFGA